jgi:hypothetical protein
MMMNMSEQPVSRLKIEINTPNKIEDFIWSTDFNNELIC